MAENLNYFKRWEERVRAGVFKPSRWQRKKVQLNHPDRKWIAANAETPVLDVACGTAVDSAFFTPYVGLDVTPSFIDMAKQYGAEHLIIGDARNIPVRDKAVTTSYTKDLLLHLPYGDAVKVIRELLRVGRRSFIAWGIGYDRGGRRVYTPVESDKDVIRRSGGFFYNRFSRKKLNRICRIGEVKHGTSITEVKEKRRTLP